METNQVIIKMLKENTGTHFLDSGGAYGRHWEQNQAREFESEPRSVVEFNARCDGTEILVTHNLYHWLKDRLEFDGELQKKFDTYCNRPENEDKHWLQLMEEFPRLFNAGGIYGEGDPVTVNTYNGEDLLSQTIQYVFFSVKEDVYFAEDGDEPVFLDEPSDFFPGAWHIESGDYILLQVHGGCDVRGGYTAPKCFKVDDNYGELAIFDNARAHIQCSQCSEHYWHTDDGCHWYEGGCCGMDYKQLETYEPLEMDEPPVPAPLNPDLFESEQTPGPYEHSGFLIIADKKGFCPICGGELEASAY